MFSLIRPDNEEVVVLQLNIDEFRSVLEAVRLLDKSVLYDVTDVYVYENLRKVACELQDLDLW